jgi:hypothetical protein
MQQLDGKAESPDLGDDVVDQIPSSTVGEAERDDAERQREFGNIRRPISGKVCDPNYTVSRSE